MIFYGDLVTVNPFENSLYSVELQGKIIRQAMEFSVANDESSILLQVSGLKIVYDMKRDPNDRIIELNVLCRACDIPRYESIEDEQFYRVIMPSFLADGGDGFTMIGENVKNIIHGPRDIDALSDYIEKFSPFALPPVSGRISFV
jgi:5'-nucleotidase